MGLPEEYKEDAKAEKHSDAMEAQGLQMCDGCYDWFPELTEIEEAGKKYKLCFSCLKEANVMVSECCGALPRSNGDSSDEDMLTCSDCREHCTYVKQGVNQ